MFDRNADVNQVAIATVIIPKGLSTFVRLSDAAHHHIVNQMIDMCDDCKQPNRDGVTYNPDGTATVCVCAACFDKRQASVSVGLSDGLT